jgi:prevent-host-death family protein
LVKLVEMEHIKNHSEVEEISAFEAKTRLSELLRATEKGHSFRIVRHGKEVARLTPPARDDKNRDMAQVLKSFQEIRRRAPRRIKLRKLIEEGRRF